MKRSRHAGGTNVRKHTVLSTAVLAVVSACAWGQPTLAPATSNQTVLPSGGTPPAVRAGCHYQADDGTQEGQIGSGGQIAWMNKFTATSGCNVVRAVEVAFGGASPVPNGSPAKVCVWEDPNDDGNPSDAVLLVAQDVVVANANTGIPTSYQLATPVSVSGVFFVGAAYGDATLYPASYDNNGPYVPNNAWYAGGASLNLNNLAASSYFGPGDSFGLFGNPLVRASGGAGPFTYQGVLKDQGIPVTGLADFKFTLFDAPTGGSSVSSTTLQPGTQVNDGTFTARFSTESTSLDGRPMWLEIEARYPAGSGLYTKLTPRQLVTPALLAERANTAKTAETAQTATEAITAQTLSGTITWNQVTGKPTIPDGSSLDASDGSPAKAVQVDANGFVGINIPAPLGRLHVVDATGGTGSVRLPANAIDASEVLDEPGIANSLTAIAVPNTGAVVTLASQTITVPAAGYVVAFATMEASQFHTAGVADSANIGVSNVVGAFPAGGFQDIEWFVASAVPTSQLDIPVTVHGAFKVSAPGAYAFHAVAQKTGVTMSCNDINLTLMYFPTAYGPVTTNFRGNGADLDPAAGAGGHPRPASAPLAASPDVQKELDALREEVADLRSLRDEIKALKAQLQGAPRR